MPAPAASGQAAPASDAVAPVTLQASADRTAVTVGDPVAVTYTVRHPAGYTILSFDPSRNLEALTLLDVKEGSPKTLENGQIEETRVLILAAYATGAKEIPAITVVYRDPSGAEGQVSGKAIALDVASVLQTGQKDPADIKPVVSMPEKAIWPSLLLGALIVGAALAYFWWRRRRRAPEAVAAAPAAPPRPAHEIAYAELERLLSSGLLEKGAVKEFYIELAEIGRRYLRGALRHRHVRTHDRRGDRGAAPGARDGRDHRQGGRVPVRLRPREVRQVLPGAGGDAAHRRGLLPAGGRDDKIAEPLPGTAPPLTAAGGALS